jgi:hypothetical protein
MPFDQIGVLLIGVAVIAALVVGGFAASVMSAVSYALVVWVLFLVGWYLWGPPLPYIGLASNSFAAIGTGVGLCVVATLVQWARGLVRA